MFIYQLRGKRLFCQKKNTKKTKINNNKKQTNKNDVCEKHEYIFSTCIARRYNFEFQAEEHAEEETEKEGDEDGEEGQFNS